MNCFISLFALSAYSTVRKLMAKITWCAQCTNLCIFASHERSEAVCASLSIKFNLSLCFEFWLKMHTQENWTSGIIHQKMLTDAIYRYFRLTYRNVTNRTDSISTDFWSFALIKFAYWFCSRKSFQFLYRKPPVNINIVLTDFVIHPNKHKRATKSVLLSLQSNIIIIYV